MKKPSASWRLICNAIVAGAVLVAAGCGGESSIVDRLHDQTKRYPGMQIADAYKFVHQAAFGNGHLITDENAAREYLRSELDGVTADESEPLVDPVTPDGSVVRVNLRPFKARQLDAKKLGDVMLASAKKFKPNRAQFEAWWKEVTEASTARRLPFEAALLKTFGATRQAEDYPAVHHSEIYNDRYHPAYRVVLADLYRAIFAP